VDLFDLRLCCAVFDREPTACKDRDSPSQIFVLLPYERVEVVSFA
jgi:hypothetical protein